jgi:hypothetical protein
MPDEPLSGNAESVLMGAESWFSVLLGAVGWAFIEGGWR